jgi:hypothetical protein
MLSCSDYAPILVRNVDANTKGFLLTLILQIVDEMENFS